MTKQQIITKYNLGAYFEGTNEKGNWIQGICETEAHYYI